MIDQVLERLSRLHPKVIDLSLDRVLHLLARMGDPQAKLPPVVHVAGTNGKGSTVATLRAVLEAAGLVVHVYTSPHLVRFAERIRIAGQIPSDQQMLDLLQRVEAINGDQPITFFEVTTAAAFLAFAETPAHVVILETGLGGRLDATNVVDIPALTVLTPIDLDHQSFLGDTLAAIAGEKAGILKAGTPCITARQLPEADQVITARADRLGVRLIRQGVDFHAAATPSGMDFDGIALPAPVLPGAFQIGNAALALAAARNLAENGHIPTLTNAQLAQGVQSVRWPARLQRLTHGPLVDALPDGWELWLDGGHNPHAAQALAQHMPSWGDRPLLAIFAMLSNKDIDGYLEPLVPFFSGMAAMAIPGESSTLSATDAAQAARRHGCPQVQVADNLPQALNQVRAHSTGPARILICGSLYLAGVVLAENG